MLTRHGWAAVALAAVTLLAARVFALLELWVIGSAVAAAVVLAFVLAQRPTPTLRVDRRIAPSTVALGDPVRVGITVNNLGPRRTSALEMWEPVGNDGGAPLHSDPIPPGRWAAAAYHVPSDRRGVLTIGPLIVERSDALGLVRTTFEVAGTAEVVVLPEWRHLPFPGKGSAGRLGSTLARRALGRSGSEFHSQRPYVPGDDTRRVNWKASARSETLIVRESEQEAVRRCTVILDTDGASYDDASFERAVSIAASVVAAATSASIDTRLIAGGIEVTGTHVAAAALRHLAGVERGTEVADRRSTTGDGGHGLLVAISGSTAAARRVAGHNSADDTLVAIACHDAAPAASGDDARHGRFVIAAQSLDGFRDEWTRLVTGTAP